DAGRAFITGVWSGRDWAAFTEGKSMIRKDHAQTKRWDRDSDSVQSDHDLMRARDSSPEIIEHDVQVGWRGRPSVQARIDDPSASFDCGFVPEVVRRFENDPGHIYGFVRPRLV